MIIALEGPEGSGKGTQIKLLENALINKGYDVLSIVEPGGTPTGQAIRDVLLNRSELQIIGITEVFLFSASRAQLVETVVRPALKSGKIILTDRSFWSTLAYQGAGRGFDTRVIKVLTDIAIGNTKPNAVVLLDLDPKIGLARKRDQNEFNRLDAEDLSFHYRVREEYLRMAKNSPKLWKVVDAEESIEIVHSKILEIVLNIIC